MPPEWQLQLWCYRVIHRRVLALSSLDIFGEVATVCGVWRVVKEEHVQNFQVSICHISDFRAQRLVGKFCKLMDHSGSATVLWIPSVFTSHVSVTCVFMRGFGLHCAVHWQSTSQSAFPIRLQFMPGGVLGSLLMCSQLLWDHLIPYNLCWLAFSIIGTKWYMECTGAIFAGLCCY